MLVFQQIDFLFRQIRLVCHQFRNCILFISRVSHMGSIIYSHVVNCLTADCDLLFTLILLNFNNFFSYFHVISINIGALFCSSVFKQNSKSSLLVYTINSTSTSAAYDIITQVVEKVITNNLCMPEMSISATGENIFRFVIF